MAKKQNAKVGAFLDIREKRHAPDLGVFNFARFEKLHQEMHRACCISMRARPHPPKESQIEKCTFARQISMVHFLVHFLFSDFCEKALDFLPKSGFPKCTKKCTRLIRMGPTGRIESFVKTEFCAHGYTTRPEQFLMHFSLAGKIERRGWPPVGVW